MGQSVCFISGYRLRNIQDLNGPVWLFLPGGAGLGSDYFDSLMKVINLPGAIYLLDFPEDGYDPKRWKEGLLDIVKAFENVHLVVYYSGETFVMPLFELEKELEALILICGSEPQPDFVPLKIPILLLTGELDEIAPFSNDERFPFLQKSNVVTHVIAGASHFPWMEKPEKMDQWLNLIAEVILTTERLLLRRLRESDIEVVAELLADPQVMEYSLNGPLSKEAATEYLNERIIDHYRKWGFGPWGVFDKDKGVFIGMAGLLAQEIDGQNQVEVAYRIQPRYWNKGYATEVAKGIRDWAFENLQLSHLDSIIEPSNFSSVKVAEKIGMTKFKQTVFHGFAVDVYRVRKSSS